MTEKDKIRLVHDATNKVQVDNRIRVRDQARPPGAGEMRTLQRERQERRGGAKMFAVIGDASKAHRRIKVKEEDWGYQACRREPGRVWLNTVGTYGLALAGCSSHCTLHSVLFTLWSSLSTLFSFLGILRSLLCTLYSLLCTLISPLCALYFTLHS